MRTLIDQVGGISAFCRLTGFSFDVVCDWFIGTTQAPQWLVDKIHLWLAVQETGDTHLADKIRSVIIKRMIQENHGELISKGA